MEISRGDAAAATPRPRRGRSVETGARVRYLSREALLARRASSPRGGWFEDDTIDNPATRFGRESERLAVDQYRNDTGFDVRSTGLWTSEDLRFGASPDGLVVDPTTGDEGLLEVKCLCVRLRGYSRDGSRRRRGCDVDIQRGRRRYGQRRRKVVRASAPPARFAPQIQGQLALTGFEWCDLVLWVPQHVVYFRVRRDPLYWEFFLRPKLLEFSDELRARRRALVDTSE